MQQVLFEAGPIQQQEQLPDDPDPLPFEVINYKQLDQQTGGDFRFVQQEDGSVQLYEFAPAGIVNKKEQKGYSPLPFFLDERGEITVDEDALGEGKGIEWELSLLALETGEWWAISEDGKTVDFPDEKSADDPYYSAEASKFVNEVSNPEVYQGLSQLLSLGPEFLLMVKEYYQQKGLGSPGISTAEMSFGEQDITDDKYMKMHLRNQPTLDFFARTNAAHLNNQVPREKDNVKNFEAVLSAMNGTQAFLDTLVNILTEASPVLSGKSKGTISSIIDNLMQPVELEIFNEMSTEEIKRYKLARLEKAMQIAKTVQGMDEKDLQVDNRQLLRQTMSDSGGPISRPAPVTLKEYLINIAQMLRSGDGRNASRSYLGQHASRIAFKGDGKFIIAEQTNPSRAGDNPYIFFPTMALSALGFEAHRRYHMDPSKYKAEWSKFLRPPEELDSMPAREQDLVVARVNQASQTLNDKTKNMVSLAAVKTDPETGQLIAIDAEDDGISPREILKGYFDFIDTYIPDNELIEDFRQELEETLTPLDKRETFRTPQQVWQYFYAPKSRVTYTEAFNLAQKVAPEDMTIKQQLMLSHEYALRSMRQFVGRNSKQLDDQSSAVEAIPEQEFLSAARESRMVQFRRRLSKAAMVMLIAPTAGR